VSFGFGTAAELRATAAWLANGGLPRPAARLGLVNPAVNPAQLRPGDAADLVVWDGCPLDPGSRPVAVVSGGQRVKAGKCSRKNGPLKTPTFGRR
jgi:imidazolonepropionase-like amidohydrolase